MVGDRASGMIRKPFVSQKESCSGVRPAVGSVDGGGEMREGAMLVIGSQP